MNIPAFKLKTKKDCADTLLSMIDTTSLSNQSPIQFVKFTMPIQLEDREIIFKLGNTPEICDLLFALQKTVVNRFEDAKNFYVSYDSVLNFEKVESDWIHGRMILSINVTQSTTPINEDVIQPLPFIIQPLETTVSTSPIIPEVKKPLEVIPKPTIYPIDSTLPIDDTDVTIPEPMGVYIALKNTEGLTIKKRLDLPLTRFLPLLNGWLYCSEQLGEFKASITNTPHNALTLYINSPTVWYVQDVEYSENITLDTWLQRETKQLCDELECTRVDDVLFTELVKRLTPSEFKKCQNIRESIINKGHYHTQTITVSKTVKQLRDDIQVSEAVAEIRTQTKGSIQRNKRASIPELDNIFSITPIKEVVDGQTYLVQEYIEKIESSRYEQKSQRIALFDGGQLLYYNDLDTREQDDHLINPLVEVNGKTIFPSTSINQVKLETLECTNSQEPTENQIWETKKRTYYVDKFGVKRPYNEASEVPNSRLESSFYHPPVVFNRVLQPAPATTKTKTKIEPTIRKYPKPIKLENEKVVTGSVKFCDVIGTTPCILKLNPATTGYTLTALPVKLPDSYLYDLARYVAGNVSKMSAILYLHKEITRLQSLSTDLYGGIPRTDLISMLGRLKDAVRDDVKIDPANFITSKNKLREYLNNAPFLTSTRDQYYGFYELAKVSITQEIEDQEYQYRITNLLPDDRAFYRHNLSSVLNFVRRVTYNLRNHFKTEKPDTKQIREYLQSNFNYSNCKLNVYYGEKKPRKGLIMEISHRGQIISEHHINIIDPANTEARYATRNSEGKLEKHDRNYGIVPTKLTVTPSFNDYQDDAIFYALLKTPRTDRELVKFAQSQLNKVINKYITANRSTLVGENKNAITTTVAKSAGFIDTGHGYAAIKKTFIKFSIPFSDESMVNLGKIIDLKTLKTYSIHDLTFLLEKITSNWKSWDNSSDRTIELGDIPFRKENPAKLMLNVHNFLQSKPQYDTLVWGGLINTFYLLSKLSIGFKCSNSVILTPWDIYSNDVERWEHRIKIQLISILKSSDLTRTLGVESLLQREIGDLYSTLDRLSPNWNTNQNINKHLAELHDNLSISQKLNP